MPREWADPICLGVHGHEVRREVRAGVTAIHGQGYDAMCSGMTSVEILVAWRPGPETVAEKLMAEKLMDVHSDDPGVPKDGVYLSRVQKGNGATDGEFVLMYVGQKKDGVTHMTMCKLPECMEVFEDTSHDIFVLLLTEAGCLSLYEYEKDKSRFKEQQRDLSRVQLIPTEEGNNNNVTVVFQGYQPDPRRKNSRGTRSALAGEVVVAMQGACRIEEFVASKKCPTAWLAAIRFRTTQKIVGILLLSDEKERAVRSWLEEKGLDTSEENRLQVMHCWRDYADGNTEEGWEDSEGTIPRDVYEPMIRKADEHEGRRSAVFTADDHTHRRKVECKCLKMELPLPAAVLKGAQSVHVKLSTRVVVDDPPRKKLRKGGAGAGGGSS